MPRVLVSDRLADDGLDILRQAADVDVRLGLSPAELLEVISDYHGLVVRSDTRVTSQVIDAGRELAVVGRAGVGVDNIDVDAATRRGVVVVYAPEGNTISAAEHTIALMLAMARHVPAAHASLSQGLWERSKFVGVELRGKTLGLLGLGRVGSEVARRALGLDMNVVAYDPGVGPDRFEMLGVGIATMEEVLSGSDFISLHAIVPAGSKHLLDEAQIEMIKPGARLLNVARGTLINDAALLAGLESGRIGGAALDVFDPEPPKPELLPLLSHPRVLVTPHLGASTAEAQERVAVDVAHEVLKVLRGEPAMYAVNLPRIGAEAFNLIAPYLTAAAQAASLATQLSTGQFESVEIEYLGEMAELDLSPLKASVIKGLLAPISEENVTLVNASMIAEQRGLRITEVKAPYDGIYNDLIRINLMTLGGGKTSVSSTVGHDGVHIVEINDFWVDVSPGAGYLLLCENVDKPGMIGAIGTFLGWRNINISFMRVGRETIHGRALMVLGLDGPLDASTLDEIARIPDIFSARVARI